jgi:hypothetical protein
MNKKRSGASNKTFAQLKKGNQFFLVVKMFSRVKNSFSICAEVGLLNSPVFVFQP